jgi:DNA-binding response OmpR family regulator
MPEEKNEAELAGLKILIVEDDVAVAEMVEDFLVDVGCVVVGVAPGLEKALESARTLAMDVALLDINLAGQASFPAAMELLTRKIPFLFMTGYDKWGLPNGLKNSLVLAKPFKMNKLERAIRQVVSDAPDSID